MKITIRNKDDLKTNYLWLRDSKDIVDQESVKALNDEVKRAIRAYTNKPVPFDHIVSWDDDGSYTKLIELPEDIETDEEADEYFQDYVYIRYIPRAWDCTGQRFTSWYKIFKRGNRYYAYHRVNMDV